MANDLISRQALMKEFSDFVRESNNSDFAPTPTWNDAVSLVESMPSAERRGRWLDVEHAPDNLFYATCSVCGDRQTIEVANYCPMCGASMMHDNATQHTDCVENALDEVSEDE